MRGRHQGRGSGAGGGGDFHAVDGGADDAPGVARTFAAGEQAGHLRVGEGVVPAGDAHGRTGAGFKT